MADSQAHQLHMLLFPFLAHGHLLPLVDMGFLLAERGVKVTLLTTHGNASHVRPTIDRSTASGHSMHLLLLHFPSADFGLPDGCENLASLPSPSDAPKFFATVNSLRHPLHELLHYHLLPDCIVSDSLLPWTSDLAREIGIPRLVFHGFCAFTLCITNNIEFHKLHEHMHDEKTPLVVSTGLPHRIEMTRSELPEVFSYPWMLTLLREAEMKSYGVVVNSFHELEPEYVEHYKKASARKAWCIGPVALRNRINLNTGSGDNRGEWVKNWLDSKDPESVLYACFGSQCIFSPIQLRMIASGLEDSGHPFIWVVRSAETMSEWLPEGFEERMEGRGSVIVKGWAPQVLILNHAAVGGFMTHCGWNSLMETVSAGVPVITWPLHSEQFINEKLIVQVLRIGVGVLEGVMSRTVAVEKEVVSGESIRNAVVQLMDKGEAASCMRKRAKELGAMAKSAVEESGSSYLEMSCLIEELSLCAQEKRAKGKE